MEESFIKKIEILGPVRLNGKTVKAVTAPATVSVKQVRKQPK